METKVIETDIYHSATGEYLFTARRAETGARLPNISKSGWIFAPQDEEHKAELARMAADPRYRRQALTDRNRKYAEKR